MIRYALACEQAHEFESWFSSSDAFEGQKVRGLISCPLCGSEKVQKQVMAPRVARTDSARKESARADKDAPLAPNLPVQALATAPEPSPPHPMALLAEKERE